MDDSKRKFINICLGGLGALAVTGSVSVVYPLFRYYFVPPSEKAKGKVTLSSKNIMPGDANFFEFNGTAAVLLKKQDGTFIAFSAVCPHLGCIVQWEKDKQNFLCPCHAGYFTPDGAVISGPPPRGLEKIPFTVANDVVTLG